MPPGKSSPPSIAVVIPAKNEERFLPELLESIQQQFQDEGWEYEIAVADNGSSDRTSEIAIQFGAQVINCGGATVGEARNRAVSATKGDVLIFLDADMVLRKGWSVALTSVLLELKQQSNMIVGGSIAAPPDRGWVGRVWFPDHGDKRRTTRHVGSGHMVLLRSHFEALGGFNSALQASEDYDLCRRTLEAGGRIIEDNGLSAYHKGAPCTIGEFVRRELWHGGASNLRDLLKQRVTILAACWLGMHLGLLIFGWLTRMGGGRWIEALAVLCGAGIVGLLVASVLRHTQARRLSDVLGLFVLFYVYYWCRAAGLLRCLLFVRKESILRTPRS